MSSFIAPAQAAESAATLPGFGDLVAKVKPAVISVRVRIDQDNDKSAMLQQNRMDSDEDSPLDQFSRQFGFRGQGGMNGMPRQRHQVITGEGSGFFISADGYAVTNNHVVDHAESVQVTMDDGTIYTAKVVGTDPKTDLALIKVDGKKDFPFVKFSDQKPRIGDWVVAVGNPFGLGGTVTAGIVSASGRDIGNGPYDDFIQIDAPINKGNSGGPAFDMNGNVIGVNTAIFSPSGRHRLRHSGLDREARHRTAEGQGHGHARLARRAGAAGERRDRRQPWPEGSARRDRRQPAGRQPRGEGRHRGR
jgi:serine protease Do